MPNQEEVINRDRCVTYSDNPGELSTILLPNREPMQVNSLPPGGNLFCE